MEGSIGSWNRERMIGTQGKIDAGRGMDLFRSGNRRNILEMMTPQEMQDADAR